MRTPPFRAGFAAVTLSAVLGLGAVACTRAEEPAAPPAGGASTSTPAGGATQDSSANTVPPGASQQGSQGGEGVTPASP